MNHSVFVLSKGINKRFYTQPSQYDDLTVLCHSCFMAYTGCCLCHASEAAGASWPHLSTSADSVPQRFPMPGLTTLSSRGCLNTRLAAVVRPHDISPGLDNSLVLSSGLSVIGTSPSGLALFSCPSAAPFFWPGSPHRISRKFVCWMPFLFPFVADKNSTFK